MHSDNGYEKAINQLNCPSFGIYLLNTYVRVIPNQLYPYLSTSLNTQARKSDEYGHVIQECNQCWCVEMFICIWSSIVYFCRLWCPKTARHWKKWEKFVFLDIFLVFSENLRVFCSKYSYELLGKGEVHRGTYYKTNKKENYRLLSITRVKTTVKVAKNTCKSDFCNIKLNEARFPQKLLNMGIIGWVWPIHVYSTDISQSLGSLAD